MQSYAAILAIKKPLPVLFVYIGWAGHYDGTEPIRGSFSYLKKHPKAISEAHAFYRDTDGLYHCGIGRGELSNKRLHVTFVAQDPTDHQLKIVGLYPDARVEMDDYWAVAICRHAVLIPSDRRQTMTFWPQGQGLRRWAWRAGSGGAEHGKLRKVFTELVRKLGRKGRTDETRNMRQAVDEELAAFEGKMKKNRAKYPIEKARGSAKKYHEL